MRNYLIVRDIKKNKQVLCYDVTNLGGQLISTMDTRLLEWYPEPRYSVQYLADAPIRNTHIDEDGESAFILECDGTIGIHNLPNPLLLQDAVNGLDIYLNAGDKEARTAAAVYAKRIYEKYHGIDYKNETER